MAKNYLVLHYIQNQLKNFDNNVKVSELLFKCFSLLEKTKEHDGCLSTSVALFVCLKELGYNPELCYGLCSTKNGNEFYHAWIELDNKVIDIAIYGNLNFSPFTAFKIPVDLPIVLENYDDCYINYKKFIFDESWEYAAIKKAEDWTIFQYINNSPQKGMYKIINKLMNEPLSYKVENIVAKYKGVKISSFKEKYC